MNARDEAVLRANTSQHNPRQLGVQAAVSGAKVLVGFIAILAFAFALWAGFVAVVQNTTVVTGAEIADKRELIEFGLADNWVRVFEVDYRYRVGSEEKLTGASQNVNRDFYEGCVVGSPVLIHYSRYEVLRHIEDIGSYIDGTSAISRLRYGLSQRDLVALCSLLFFAMAGLGAFAFSSRVLGLFSLLFLGVFSPYTMLAAFALLIFPILFWAWRKKPAQGFGWLLIAASAGTLAVTHWRVPRAEPLPAGPLGRAEAVVRRFKLVTNIWDVGSPGAESGRGRSGQKIQTPFYLLDLQFTPEGGASPIHAVDRVDTATFSELKKGTSVQVMYSRREPHAAQVVDAPRTFTQAIFFQLMVLTFGSTAVLTFVAVPLLAVVKKLLRYSPAGAL